MRTAATIAWPFASLRRTAPHRAGLDRIEQAAVVDPCCYEHGAVAVPALRGADHAYGVFVDVVGDDDCDVRLVDVTHDAHFGPLLPTRP